MTESRQEDELTLRYREASAHDTRRPGDHVREVVRAHAQSVIASASDDAARPLYTRTPAANQSHWKISLLASIALAGITGLLVLQFDRGRPEEKELVFGRPDASPAARLPELPPVKSEPGKTPGSPEAPVKAARKTTAASTATPKPAPAQAPARRADAAPTGESSGSLAPAAVPTLRASPAAAARAPAAQQNDNNMAPAAPQTRMKAAASSDLDLALRQAARTGNTPQLERLVAQGATVNSPDEAGRTALMLAVMNNHTATVQRLLALGASAAVTDHEGFTALQHARRLGLDGIATLLESGS